MAANVKFKYWNQVFLALAGLLLVAQFSSITYDLAKFAESRGILQAFDDDAAAAIEVTDKTRLYNDNHWSAYGPLYYRVANTLSQLAPLADGERSTHFFLMLTSLLSAYGLCLLLTWIWPMSWAQRIVAMCVLMGCFLHEKTWAELLIRAHPDWLLCLVTGLTFYFLYRLTESPQNKNYFHLAAAGIALAFLTKKIFLFFAPSALLMFFSVPELRPRWKEFLKWTLIDYFVIGFPQAFRADREIKFLIYQSQYSAAPDMASTLEWLQLTGAQLALPLLGLIAVGTLLTQPPSKPARRPHWAIVLSAALIPLLWLMTRKILSPHFYYTLPFVTVMLVLAGFALRFLPAVSRDERRTAVVFAALLLIGSFTGFFTPQFLAEKYAKEAPCRTQAENVYQQIVKSMDQGDKLYVDPYVPFPTDKKYQAPSRGGWQKSWDEALQFDANVLALSATFYRRYTDSETPSEYTQKDNANWPQARAFYLSFINGDTAQDPRQRHWQKVLDSGACGWQIWRLGEK